MKIDILSLFPNMFNGFLNESIIKRAISNKKVVINIIDFRQYSTDIHKKVDDYAFGGGKGMVLMPQPIFDCIDNIRTKESIVILMTPQGLQYKQNIAVDLSKEKHIIIICGHYEGFDERIRKIVDMEISIGDYILTGGELASMIVTDSIVRLIDDVIKKESYENDSFSNNLLDYPVYTKPVIYRQMKVPEVLLSGHHENITKWRKEQALKKTQERRPDLLEKS
ncbi:MAG: tRNA (guanosine(37)-N1)-methyltransferase TrmD [Bacilli bacterium]